MLPCFHLCNSLTLSEMALYAFLAFILVVPPFITNNGVNTKGIHENSGKFMLGETPEEGRAGRPKYLVVDKKDGRSSLIKILTNDKRNRNQLGEEGRVLPQTYFSL